jgi:processing peptidase subunit beta
VLFEHLHDAAYLDTPMGMSVLGTPETVHSFTSSDVAAFQAAFVTQGRTVVAASGNVDAKAFAAAAQAAFGGLPSSGGAVALADSAPATFTGSDKRIRYDSKPAAYVALAFEGAKHGSPDQIPLMVLSAYLGGFDTANGPGTDFFYSFLVSTNLPTTTTKKSFKVFIEFSVESNICVLTSTPFHLWFFLQCCPRT